MIQFVVTIHHVVTVSNILYTGNMSYELTGSVLIATQYISNKLSPTKRYNASGDHIAKDNNQEVEIFIQEEVNDVEADDTDTDADDTEDKKQQHEHDNKVLEVDLYEAIDADAADLMKKAVYSSNSLNLNQSLILICDSSRIGVFGLQINGDIITGDLLNEIIEKNKDTADLLQKVADYHNLNKNIKVNNTADNLEKNMPVQNIPVQNIPMSNMSLSNIPMIYSGGMHNTEALFILHSADDSVDNEHLLVSHEDFGVTQWSKETASLYYMYDKAILVAGYMFWTLPQFKSELKKMYWMPGKVDADTIFDTTRMKDKWNFALKHNHLNLNMLGMSAYTI